VVEAGTGLELVFEGAEQIAYRLAKAPGGVWLGERLCIPQSEVRLDELTAIAATQAFAGRNSLVEVVIEASGVASGAGAVARERLIGTLQLLLRAEPGIRDAIEHAARRSSEVADIVADVFAREPKDHSERIGSSIEVVHEGYQLPDSPNP
jgi:hypothetical protein